MAASSRISLRHKVHTHLDNGHATVVGQAQDGERYARNGCCNSLIVRLVRNCTDSRLAIASFVVVFPASPGDSDHSPAPAHTGPGGEALQCDQRVGHHQLVHLRIRHFFDDGERRGFLGEARKVVVAVVGRLSVQREETFAWI